MIFEFLLVSQEASSHRPAVLLLRHLSRSANNSLPKPARSTTAKITSKPSSIAITSLLPPAGFTTFLGTTFTASRTSKSHLMYTTCMSGVNRTPTPA
jgi:hypothetical protein